MPKTFFKEGYLSTVPAIYQTRCSFSAFRTLPYDPDYSLCGLGMLDIDTQLNVLEIKWSYTSLNPANALWEGSHKCSQGSLSLFF